MKTVLLLAYQYPPAQAVSARRSGCMAKYLPHYGWRAVVVSRLWTPQNGQYDPNFVQNLPPEALVAAIPDGNNRRPFTGAFARLRMFVHPSTNPHRWTHKALQILPQIVGQYKPDAIWATCPPHATHYLANHLSRALRIPWIADFRDVIGQSGSVERFHNRFLNLRILPAEKRLIKSASAITTVSEGLAGILEARYHREIDVVPNGFDPDDYSQNVLNLCDKFIIAYFGSVYTYRDPRPLFAALDLLQDNREIQLEDIRVRFYGQNSDYISSLARIYRCSRIVECHAPIPHSEVARCQQEASILLVLSCPRGEGILTGKVFEYLGARRPIMCIPTDRAIYALLRETKAGVSCSTVDEVTAQLMKWYREWKSTGTVICHSKEEIIQKYSRRRQAEQLAQLLDSVALSPTRVGACVAEFT